MARAIVDAQAVLSGLRSPELVPGQTPELLVAVRRDVATCVSNNTRPPTWPLGLCITPAPQICPA